MIMGKGDMKTKKGKINRGTFGASRPRKQNNVLTRKQKLGIKTK